MDWVGPSIEIVKLVGGRFVRYLKYQIKYNDLLQKLEQSKQCLHNRKHEIESEQETQLQSAPYHVVKAEVEDWLREVEEFIERQNVVDEVNSWGYLSCCCRAVILEERTQELKEIYDRGDNYTKECLVIEDHSKKLKYYVKNFNELKEKLQHGSRDTGSTLRSQLVLGKIEKEQVKHWLEKVEEMLKGVKDIEDKIGGRLSHSSDSLAMLLGEKIQEMERICEEGSQLPECLVIEDHSWKLNYHVKNFDELKEKLRRKQGDIRSILHSQLVHGKIEMEQVKHWLEKVEEILKEVKDIEDKIGGCLSHASDSLMLLLGAKIQEMERIYEEGSQLPKSLVIDDPSASAIELPTSKLQGSEDIKAEILACLIGDEVTKLGVWGMGGIGKTTIMMHVHNELQKQPKFKKIIWVTVSQTFDICKLQEQIVCSLKEHLPERQNTTIRAAMLSKMLERHKPYVLILDDVWKSFDPKVIGIPEPLVTDGCKLVLTTRSQEVARSMGCQRIKVKTLSQEEALKLFLDKVGDIVLSDHGVIKANLESSLKGIVDECDGLPLAIITVAGGLKEISEPRLWSAALYQLRDCKRNVVGIDDDDAFRILKFSYDRLKIPQIQHCFLYCALYPEDYNIPKENIIEYWIEEGFIDEMETRQAMKDEGHDVLRKLEDNCLLEFTKGRFGKDCVRMHDVVRDMALHITRTSPRFLVKAGILLKELPEKGKWTEDLEKVSLMENEIEEIPSTMLSSKWSLLTTLLLPHNKLLTIPESVFEHMPELKILDLSYNRFLHSLPNSVSKLMNLSTLLLHFTGLREVPSLSELRDLKKLDLGRGDIEEVPRGLEMLTNLKYLDLSTDPRFLGGNSRGIEEISDEILSNLSKLQHFFLDEDKIALKGEVIGRLVKLEAFRGRFLTVHDMNIFLKCLHDQGDGLSRYACTIGRCPSRVVVDYMITGLNDLEYKKLMAFTGIDIVGDSMLLLSAQVLSIEGCNNIRSLNDISAIKDASDLRECFFEYCEGLECVFSSWINPLVQNLEHLRLLHLDNLDALFEGEAIGKSPPPPGYFSSLKRIAISQCNKIKKLFPSWILLGYLQNLEDINVCDCEQMEEIIASDPEEGGGGGVIKFILPKLKCLSLFNLLILKSICSRAVMICDSLQQITFGGCTGLKRMPLYLPLFDNDQPFLPPSLKTITIDSREKEWWESLEWEHPNAKDALQPFCEIVTFAYVKGNTENCVENSLES